MRWFVLVVATVVALVGVTGAQAKAPPDGVQICGAAGVCVHASASQVEREWALFLGLDYGSAAARPSPFYVVHWHWPNGPENSGYYIPSAGMTRQLDPDGNARWLNLNDPRTVRSWTSGLAPFPAPTFTRVTIGNRAVRAPASYARLFGRGFEVLPAILPGWLPITFAASGPSPWTDPGTDIRVSTRGRYLWENGTIVKIPLKLAQRIRAGKPLR